MHTRSVILRACRAWSVLPVLLPAIVALGGCRSSTPVPVAPSRPTASVLALPSAAQIASAERAGIPVSLASGRRNEVLGGPAIDERGPSVARVDVRSDQRIVNGRVYGNLRWRTRTVETRGR